MAEQIDLIDFCSKMICEIFRIFANVKHQNVVQGFHVLFLIIFQNGGDFQDGD
jgi:hypothetical protein